MFRNTACTVALLEPVLLALRSWSISWSSTDNRVHSIASDFKLRSSSVIRDVDFSHCRSSTKLVHLSVRNSRSSFPDVAPVVELYISRAVETISKLKSMNWSILPTRPIAVNGSIAWVANQGAIVVTEYRFVLSQQWAGWLTMRMQYREKHAWWRVG